MNGMMQSGPTLYEAERLRKQRGSQGLLAAVGEPMSYAPGPVGLLGNALLGAQYLTGEKPLDEGLSSLEMMTGLLQGTKVAPIMRGAKAAAKHASAYDDASAEYNETMRAYKKAIKSGFSADEATVLADRQREIYRAKLRGTEPDRSVSVLLPRERVSVVSEAGPSFGSSSIGHRVSVPLNPSASDAEFVDLLRSYINSYAGISR